MSLCTLNKFGIFRNIKLSPARFFRCFSTEQNVVEKQTDTIDQNVKQPEKSNQNQKPFSELAGYRFIFPEFLPDPRYELRNKVREKLEREDMLKRRSVINIPEFYVGSILAVTCSDPYALGKEIRFVGICIARTYVGLRATFILRNIVDGQGIEILYDMYSPQILSIEVLKLEKRLDEELLYLRDAPPEFSTFPFDMEPEFIIHGEPVKVNPLKVRLKPLPWYARWEKRNLKGIENIEEHIDRDRVLHARKIQQPWEEYDLMKEYRRCIPEDDQVEIWQDVDAHRTKFPVKQQAWKRTLQKSKAKPKRIL